MAAVPDDEVVDDPVGASSSADTAPVGIEDSAPPARAPTSPLMPAPPPSDTQRGDLPPDHSTSSAGSSRPYRRRVAGYRMGESKERTAPPSPSSGSRAAVPAAADEVRTEDGPTELGADMAVADGSDSPTQIADSVEQASTSGQLPAPLPRHSVHTATGCRDLRSRVSEVRAYESDGRAAAGGASRNSRRISVIEATMDGRSVDTVLLEGRRR